MAAPGTAYDDPALGKDPQAGAHRRLRRRPPTTTAACTSTPASPTAPSSSPPPPSAARRGRARAGSGTPRSLAARSTRTPTSRASRRPRSPRPVPTRRGRAAWATVGVLGRGAPAPPAAPSPVGGARLVERAPLPVGSPAHRHRLARPRRRRPARRRGARRWWTGSTWPRCPRAACTRTASSTTSTSWVTAPPALSSTSPDDLRRLAELLLGSAPYRPWLTRGVGAPGYADHDAVAA